MLAQFSVSRFWNSSSYEAVHEKAVHDKHSRGSMDVIAATSRDRSRKTTPTSGRQVTPTPTSGRQVTPASSSATAPKPKGGFGSATGRFENPGCQSDSQREAKAEERLEALLAEPAEEGAQVVVGPTRCAAPWPLPTLACAPQPSRPDSSPQESAQVEACGGDVRTLSPLLLGQAHSTHAA